MNNQVKVTEKTEMTEDEMKTFVLNQLLTSFKLYEDKIAQSEAKFLSLIATLSPKLEELSDVNSKEYEDFVDTYRKSAGFSNEIAAARVILRDLNNNLKEVIDKLTIKDYYHISISSRKGKATSIEHLILSIAEALDSNEEDYKKFIDNSIEVLQDLKNKLINKKVVNSDSSNFH